MASMEKRKPGGARHFALPVQDITMKSIVARLVTVVVICSSPSLADGAESTSRSVDAGGASSGCGKPLAANLAAGKTSLRSMASGSGSRSYLLHVPANYDA